VDATGSSEEVKAIFEKKFQDQGVKRRNGQKQPTSDAQKKPVEVVVGTTVTRGKTGATTEPVRA